MELLGLFDQNSPGKKKALNQRQQAQKQVNEHNVNDQRKVNFYQLIYIFLSNNTPRTQKTKIKGQGAKTKSDSSFFFLKAEQSQILIQKL